MQTGVDHFGSTATRGRQGQHNSSADPATGGGRNPSHTNVHHHLRRVRTLLGTAIFRHRFRRRKHHRRGTVAGFFGATQRSGFTSSDALHLFRPCIRQSETFPLTAQRIERSPYENDNLRQASDKLPLIDGHTRASLRIASLIFKITSLRFTHSLMSAHPQACSKLFF